MAAPDTAETPATPIHPATFVPRDPRIYFPEPRRSATFNDDRTHRYDLTITWSVGGMGRAHFCMLNPSTADELKNDATITRCQNYARAWGFDGLDVSNLFSFKATKPEHMKAQADPTGDPRNAQAILRLAGDAAVTVCAWGTPGQWFNGRGPYVLAMLRATGARLIHLGLLNRDASGSPKHPLYLGNAITAYDFMGQPANLAREWYAEIERRREALSQLAGH